MRNICCCIVICCLLSCSLLSCHDSSSPIRDVHGVIQAYVHWESQGIGGKVVMLVQTGDTLRTDSTGRAAFTVLPGRYTVRAFGINRGGPGYRTLDFSTDARPGDTTLVDIIDCLPCL